MRNILIALWLLKYAFVTSKEFGFLLSKVIFILLIQVCVCDEWAKVNSDL
jgi:hypothetical protein